LTHNKKIGIKIVTTIPARVSKKWKEETSFVKPPQVFINSRLFPILYSLKLFILSRRCDAVITPCDRVANRFALLQGLLCVNPIPHLMIDCLWYKPEPSLFRFIKRVLSKIANRGVRKYVVWAKHEMGDYPRVLDLPGDKFVYIPFHTTTEGYDYQVEHGDYIFAGGDGDRDYSTLIEAVKNIPVKVYIATRTKIDGYSNEKYPNVLVKATSPEDFRKLMAGSLMVVVPMKGGLLHSGGQQTYLNAMRMAKPVIVCSPAAGDYIEHWRTGVILPNGDVNGLRDAIVRLMKDSQLAIEMGRAAEDSARLFSTENTMGQVLELAKSLIR
jgi:glycosyltransferase involved in cell wall biosynthesis